MKDFASSDHPGVQAQLDRLPQTQLPGTDVDLAQIKALLPLLGHPERRLPPVLHVAGTNGKGSTCALLRAALEADGRRVHVFTSPHLVRLNERIRLGGTLIDDDFLALLLEEVIDKAGGRGVSFFEAMTAAAFLAFSRAPAEACILEVGLGGRLDATNVVPAALVCGIAQLGLDHQRFLGDSLAEIAAEKAAIAKPGVPLVTLRYPRDAAAEVSRVAGERGAIWCAQGAEWDIEVRGGQILYRDERGSLDFPLPALPGAHQATNAGLAVAMLRHQTVLNVEAAAFDRAMGAASWPARLQRLGDGPLRGLLGQDGELWLDGGHNPAAAEAIAKFFRAQSKPDRPLHLVLGLLANKDAAGLVAPFADVAASLTAVPVPGHDHHDPEMLAAVARTAGLSATSAASPADALAAIGRDNGATAPLVLIMGSLYLAGEVLRANCQPPD